MPNEITQELDPLKKPFLCAKDFVKVFGSDCCSISRAYGLIHDIQKTKDKNGEPLFDQSRCPRKNLIPNHVFIKYFDIRMKPKKKEL